MKTSDLDAFYQHREVAFERRDFAVSDIVTNFNSGTETNHHGKLVQFLRGQIWIGNPGPKVTIPVEVPVEVRFEHEGHVRVPATWWDMFKESWIARNYTFATGLMAWGLLSDVRYDARTYKSRARQSSTRRVDVQIQVHEVLPAAVVPPMHRGPVFMRSVEVPRLEADL